nr:FAST kinase domain-containing protein 3, mitochondrial-like [Cherax quadricarinatus]
MAIINGHVPFVLRRLLRYCNAPILSRKLHWSSHCQKDDEKTITSTTVFVQDGTNIEELPAVVQIINGEFTLFTNGKTQVGKRLEGPSLEIPQVSRNLFKNINFEEQEEMILGFMRCSKLGDIFKLLEICPETEVTPLVALAVIKRIFELENNIEYRNHGMNLFPEESPFTFTRGAVMKRLVEIVCGSSDPQILIDTLRVMGRDTYQGDKLKYLEALCTECIVLITEGKMKINQVCEATKAFYNLGNIGFRYVEQIWVGITEKTEEIQEKEISNIMSVLPLVTKSRKHLYNVAERRMGSLWYKLKPEDVIRILHILVQLKVTNSRMLPMLSRWTNLNIHTLTEGNLRWIVYSFTSLNYTNPDIIKALSRFMKAKKVNISDQSLLGVIMDYCVKMRIRSPDIMNNAGEYFIKNSQKLTVQQINSLGRSYGLLNYEPPNASAFFLALEMQLYEKFVQFPPDIMIDLLLSCVYLKRYPLNFVKKIFNPYFFDKIHSLDSSDMRLARTKLKVLDKALCLEAPNYNGPMLPRDHSAKSFWHDARIKRCVNMIHVPLVEIVGTEERITPYAVLPNFPGTKLYIIDCIIDMSGKLSLRSFKWSNNKYALLIHPPEHYILNEEILVGPQAMRRRHLALCGFKVVSLSYQKIIKLCMYPELLKDYIEATMKEATL